MKIPLNIRDRFGGFAPVTYIKIKAPRRFRLRPFRIETLLDTGSPWTVLTPSGSKLLNLNEHQLSNLDKPDEYPNVLLGGNKFYRRLMKDVTLYFRDIHGKPINFDLDEINILEPMTEIEEEMLQLDFHIIIGVDFLKEFNLGFYFNPSNEEAYMEK